MSFEYKFIFSILIFYGFLAMLYGLNGGSFFGLGNMSITFSTPSQPTGNALVDWLNSASQTVSLVIGFFTTFFVTPFTSGYWIFLGFINWALFGTMVYLFIRVIRGGG